MSDFIYSKKLIKHGELTKEIQSIYHQAPPAVKEFHGEWGSLAVSDNLYNVFQPFDSTEYLCVVIGGPILSFQENKFSRSNPRVAGTQSVLTRWLEGTMHWDEDLSGPFSVLIINKITTDVLCVTDLMSFIPVYTSQNSENTVLSTHVDMLARISDQQDDIDIVSEVDFILHGVVTFPYTIYKNIFQIKPASEHSIIDDMVLQSIAYWIPMEDIKYKSINDAAKDLRYCLGEYVNSIINETSNIAQFISGGEDSRTLSALLQVHSRNGFIFLDQMNREGRVAKKAADAYGANFNMAKRNKLHYLEILPASSDLVGSGSQYHHAHTYGFHKDFNFEKYDAVFGGLFSDALLKGACVKKIRGSGRFPFLPQIKNSSYSRDHPFKDSIFNKEILLELRDRRKSHLNYVKSFRRKSAEEWFELWPSSMDFVIPNLHANRRLFRTYEPFMSNEVVKISASVPQDWKLNRRLFYKATKPLLKKTKWLFHGDGRLPYFSWKTNILIQFVTWIYRESGKKLGLIKGNQGSWTEWNLITSSLEWEKAMIKYLDGEGIISHAITENDVKILFNSDKLNKHQKVNLMQILYINK